MVLKTDLEEVGGGSEIGGWRVVVTVGGVVFGVGRSDTDGE